MAAVNLTSNAIAMIWDGEITGGDGTQPVLQVTDIKMVSSGQQNSNNERYRMLLSDGLHLHQGMLATQMNHLVKSQNLQKGSVVQLAQFVSQVVQNRKILIIVELVVILEKCDLIGDPKVYVQSSDGPASVFAPQGRTSPHRQPSADHARIASGNPQSIVIPTTTAPPQSGFRPEPNAIGRASLHNSIPNPNPSNIQSYGSSSNNNSDTRGFSTTNGPSVYPRAEAVARTGNYGDQNRNFMNSRSEVGSRAPPNTCVRPQQPYQQPQAMYSNRGPIGRNEAPARIVPIAALNPYQGRWTIKARVTSKTDLRHYNNSKGDGKVFSFDLLDSDGGEIQVTCFNSVADQFYNMIESGRVYLISKGSIKPASKNFSRLQNDHAITLESASTVELLEDDDTIPKQQFHFRPIGEIENMESNSIVDVIGVVSSIYPSASIMKKDGTETLKRALQLKDMSGRSVELTLWGNFCNAEGQQLQNLCDNGVFPVLAVKAGRVTDFSGKSLGTLSSTQLIIQPEFPEALNLRQWFDTEGKNKPSISISGQISGGGRVDTRKTISQIKDERLGTSEKPDWVTVSATVSYIKLESFCYTGCPLMINDRKCSKKVINDGDGQWRCDRCDKSVPECDYRYLLNFQVQDHTGSTWVTAFQECGEELMGISAKDLYYLKNMEQDSEKFEDIVRGVLFKAFLFKLRVKEETFSDESRVKCTVVKAENLDVSSESKFLVDAIAKLGDNSVPSVGNVTEAGMSSYTSQVGSGVLVVCTSCGGTGHNANHCPSITTSRPMVSRSGPVGDGPCYRCNQTGHWASQCPGTNLLSSVYQNGAATPAGRYGGVPRQQQRVGF